MHPAFGLTNTYRAKPQPPKPREWWLVDGCEAYDSLQEARDAIRQLRYRGGYRGDEPIIHVIEVIE